jgi:hypothetical protein
MKSFASQLSSPTVALRQQPADVLANASEDKCNTRARHHSMFSSVYPFKWRRESNHIVSTRRWPLACYIFFILVIHKKKKKIDLQCCSAKSCILIHLEESSCCDWFGLQRESTRVYLLALAAAAAAAFSASSFCFLAAAAFSASYCIQTRGE